MGLFRGRTTVTRANKISDFTVATAEYGSAVMEVLGTTRISGNVIYYDDFTAHEHREEQRTGKGGKSKSVNITYSYTVAAILGLCEGPVSGIRRIWKDKDIYTYPDDNVGLTLYTGTANQQPWPYVVGRHPDRALAYKNLAYVCGIIDLGESASLGNQVTGAHSGAIGDPTYIAADNSYAMGNSNNITATGARSFAIGNNNTISGSDTFVLGSNVNTNASNAVVLGNNSVGEDGAVSVGSVGGERQIRHVAPGTDANDAATVGQVAALAQNTTTVINRVDSKLNKVGAGAAALAALHPLDTDDKFTMGMGYGNYRNSHAAAIGMFYRPTDKVMISMSGTMGNGENMFNAGISFALDKGKGFSTSKAAMARKIAAQEEKISEQDAKIQSLAAENAKLAERLAAIEAKLSK